LYISFTIKNEKMKKDVILVSWHNA
jgi:hypothetical protein